MHHSLIQERDFAMLDKEQNNNDKLSRFIIIYNITCGLRDVTRRFNFCKKTVVKICHLSRLAVFMLCCIYVIS